MLPPSGLIGIPPVQRTPHTPLQNRWLLASDLDGTLLPTHKALRPQVFQHLRRQSPWLSYGVITGRPQRSTFSLALPRQTSFVMTDNGGEFYRQRPLSSRKPHFDAMQAPASHSEDLVWDGLNRQSNFNKALIKRLALGVAHKQGLPMVAFDDLAQEPSSENKLTLVVPVKSLLETYIHRLTRVLQQQLPASQWTIHPPYLDKTPQGQAALFLDISTPLANKGTALQYELVRQGWDPRHVVVAVNGGNDIELLQNDGRYAILAGNDPLLHQEALRRMPPDKIFVTNTPGFGVLEALRQIKTQHDARFPTRTIAWA